MIGSLCVNLESHGPRSEVFILVRLFVGASNIQQITSSNALCVKAHGPAVAKQSPPWQFKQNDSTKCIRYAKHTFILIFLAMWPQENDLKKTVEESARIRRAYSHFFDMTIYNDNLDKAFDQLQEAVERLFVEPQWVPVSWVYWCCPPQLWSDWTLGCPELLRLPCERTHCTAHYASHSTQEVYLFIGKLV